MLVQLELVTTDPRQARPIRARRGSTRPRRRRGGQSAARPVARIHRIRLDRTMGRMAAATLDDVAMLFAQEIAHRIGLVEETAIDELAAKAAVATRSALVTLAREHGWRPS